MVVYLILYFFLQVQLLEEEIAGRRSYWRRQRKREEELSALEGVVGKQLMENEYVTAESIRMKLDTISESRLTFYVEVNKLI